MSEDIVYLCAQTDIINSKCSTPMCTLEGWMDLGPEEREEMANEHMANIVDTYVVCPTRPDISGEDLWS